MDSLNPQPHLQGGCFCGAMVPWATFPSGSVQATTGEWAELHSSPGVTRGYCAACGSHLTYSHTGRPGELDITLASLDEPSRLAPTAHIWMEDKLPWIRIADGLPRYERTVSDA